MNNEFVWCERYRPLTIDDCVLPKTQKQAFKNMIAHGDIPNLLLVGPKGSGKTTVAKALVGALHAEYMMIDGTRDGDIETLRTKVQNFAMTANLEPGRKFVIFDEADYLTWKTQPALRGFTEEYSHNCGFIFTANYLNKIIPALQSRTAVVDFNIPKADAPLLMAGISRRLKFILDLEKVEYDKDALNGFIVRYFPDYRRMINQLQFYANSYGKIDAEVLASPDATFDELIGYMKDKNVGKTRQWITDNLDNDPWLWFDMFYENCSDHFDASFIPALIEALADYQEKATRVSNQEINTAAFLLTVMVNAVWKK